MKGFAIAPASGKLEKKAVSPLQRGDETIICCGKAQKSPEPLWFGAFLSLATAYDCFISTLERRYGLFLQFPAGGSYSETFHPLSLETSNGSIIVKARCSFYAIQNKCRRAFFATEIFGNYLKKRNEDNGSKITPIQCHDRAASINKALGRVVNYI